jgi:hypothetical protein
MELISDMFSNKEHNSLLTNIYVYIYIYIYVYYLAPTHFDLNGYPQGEYIRIVIEDT